MLRFLGSLSRRSAGRLLAVGTLLVAGVAILILSRGSSGEPAGTLLTPLDATTRDAVSASALKWTTADYRAVSGVPQGALGRVW